MACVCTELDPWPPSLITILKNIGKEILSAAITKSKKPRVEKVALPFGLSLLTKTSGPCGLSVCWGPKTKAESTSPSHSGTSRHSTPVTARPCAGPTNTVADLRGPGLSQTQSPSKEPSAQEFLWKWETKGDPRTTC